MVAVASGTAWDEMRTTVADASFSGRSAAQPAENGWEGRNDEG